MKRLSASLLVAGLAFAGTAAAQSSGYYAGQQDRYYSSSQDGIYDYARVLRVDPVIGSDYGNRGTAVRSGVTTARPMTSMLATIATTIAMTVIPTTVATRIATVTTTTVTAIAITASSEGGRTVATVIGGIAGAVLGSRIGDGSGRYVGTAVGSMVGGMAGRSIYDSSQRNRQLESRGTVRVCDPLPVTSRDALQRGSLRQRRASSSGYDVTYEYANRTYHTRTNYHPGDRIRVRVDVQADEIPSDGRKEAAGIFLS